VQYAEFPFPEPGTRELLFLSHVVLQDGTAMWIQTRPEARFVVQRDGSLTSVLKGSGARNDDFESGSWEKHSRKPASESWPGPPIPTSFVAAPGAPVPSVRQG
jgi:hypothetical protein